MKIVIPDDYQNAVRRLDCFAKLAVHDMVIYYDTVKDINILTKRFQEAEVLVLIRERTAITAELIERLPNLKLISQTGRGTTHIDIEACTRAGVAVAAGMGSPYAPAELTWALIMAAMWQLPKAITNLKDKQWQTTFGRGLRGCTLGILGYGKIGSVVAGYGRAFGMHVIIWGREGSLSRAQKDGFETITDKFIVFQQADIVSLHLKLVPETRGIITMEHLAAMKPNALFVNTSRAELIAPGALVEALQAGHPGYAAVDVYEDEPVYEHPLLRMENAICTPHLGYVEKDSYELYFGTAFDNVLAFAAGTPINIVNPEVLIA